VKLSHADIDALISTTWCALLNSLIEDGGMPTELASGVEEDIMQGRVEGVRVRDALQWLGIKAIQYDVLRPPNLVSITWQDDCNLPDSSIRGLVATSVTCGVKVKSNATLLLIRHVPGQLKSLLIEAHSQDVSARACPAVLTKWQDADLSFWDEQHGDHEPAEHCHGCKAVKRQ
jgi:hypothetical protein